MASKTHKRGGVVDKFNLMGEITRDPRATPGAVSVLWKLLDFYRADKGFAWVSLAKLAELARVSYNTADRSVALLEQLDFLLPRESGKGRKTNRYIPNFDKCSTPTGEGTTAENGVCSTPTGGGTENRSTPTGGSVVPPPVERSTPTGGVQDLLSSGYRPEVREREGDDTPPASGGGRAAPTAAEVEAGFERFWAAFPKHTGRAAAEQAYANALIQGVPAVVIEDGARAYAEYETKTGRGPRYFQPAAKWLSEQGWRDDYTLPDKPKRKNGTKPTLAAVVRLLGPDLKKRLKAKGLSDPESDEYLDAAEEWAKELAGPVFGVTDHSGDEYSYLADCFCKWADPTVTPMYPKRDVEDLETMYQQQIAQFLKERTH